MIDPPDSSPPGWSPPPQTPDTASPLDQPAPPSQPAGSPIELKRFPDGLSIRVPPAGLWKGSKGLFLFALIWNGFLLVLTPCLAASLLGGANHADAPGVIFSVLGLFWLVGICLLAGAINMGRRQAALAVAGGTLMAMQTGLLGTRQQEWELAEVTSVCVGPTGITVNDVPVMELQIHDQGGGKFGLLAGRSDQELAWLCDELRRALNVGQQGG